MIQYCYRVEYSDMKAVISGKNAINVTAKTAQEAVDKVRNGNQFVIIHNVYKIIKGWV